MVDKTPEQVILIQAHSLVNTAISSCTRYSESPFYNCLIADDMTDHLDLIERLFDTLQRHLVYGELNEAQKKLSQIKVFCDKITKVKQ